MVPPLRGGVSRCANRLLWLFRLGTGRLGSGRDPREMATMARSWVSSLYGDCMPVTEDTVVCWCSEGLKGTSASMAWCPAIVHRAACAGGLLLVDTALGKLYNHRRRISSGTGLLRSRGFTGWEGADAAGAKAASGMCGG